MTKRSEAELDAKAAEFEQWAETLDPESADFERVDDLRAVAEAADAVAAAQANLNAQVAQARAKGGSWGRIGIALGVSRQAARQRYSDLVLR
ncbi:MAG TPA: hypothetical protein VH419_16720 [Nocardioidaceae bacterium]|jgi:hypothetical protein